MKRVIQVEMNELNFEFIEAYCANGKLPTFNRLIKSHGLIETTSELFDDHLEPWIQWVSAHTGLTFRQHKVFRLGDMLYRSDLKQIWEILEDRGLSVGSLCSMNTRNACNRASYFLPDPWTTDRVTGTFIIKKLSSAISQLVNDNAQKRMAMSSLFWLGLGLLRYARPENFKRYISLASLARSKRWTRALFLDLLLSDIFISLTRNKNPHFSTVFLNAGAHLQHHHMFDASVYLGTHRNPDWYRETKDPIFHAYELYDNLLAQILTNFPNHRIIVATGLHQVPHSENEFYWRLRDHKAFLNELDIPFVGVDARMSRDFVLHSANHQAATLAQEKLSAIVTEDGKVLFDVDNRGKSLFVTLKYTYDMPKSLKYYLENKEFLSLSDKCAFVAIKNGAHDGVGYLVDTNEIAVNHRGSIRVTELFQRIINHFAD